MVDVFWTIIAVWVIFRIYNSLTSSGEKKTYFYQNNHQTNQSYQNNYRSNEGEVKINAHQQEAHRKPNSDKGGEYVDFEEVKK